MTNEELINKLSRWPKDAEVRIIVGDAEDYIPIHDLGYAPNLNMVLLDPEDREAFAYLAD